MSTASPTSLGERMRGIVGAGNVLSSPSDLLVYEGDGFTIEKNKPDVVVFPKSTAEIVAIVKACRDLGGPFVPRGDGASLAARSLPVGGVVMIALTHMMRILGRSDRDRSA